MLYHRNAVGVVLITLAMSLFLTLMALPANLTDKSVFEVAVIVIVTVIMVLGIAFSSLWVWTHRDIR